jgi:hypothetical protein
MRDICKGSEEGSKEGGYIYYIKALIHIPLRTLKYKLCIGGCECMIFARIRGKKSIITVGEKSPPLGRTPKKDKSNAAKDKYVCPDPFFPTTSTYPVQNHTVVFHLRHLLPSFYADAI